MSVHAISILTLIAAFAAVLPVNMGVPARARDGADLQRDRRRFQSRPSPDRTRPA